MKGMLGATRGKSVRVVVTATASALICDTSHLTPWTKGPSCHRGSNSSPDKSSFLETTVILSDNTGALRSRNADENATATCLISCAFRSFLSSS